MVDRNAETTSTYHGGDKTVYRNPPPKVNTRRHAKPHRATALNTRGVVQAMQASQRSLAETRQAFLRGQRVRVDDPGPATDTPKPRTSKIFQEPRLPKNLRKRHAILAAKCRDAAAKSPMHLASLMRTAA